MKKLILLFSATLLVLSSCSKEDDSSSTGANSILLKKRTSTDGDKNYTIIFTYNGNKIESGVSSIGYRTNFTYTGDVITKKEELRNNIIETTTEYTYANGKVASLIIKEQGEDYNIKTTYTYNVDGTVSFADFKINKTTGAIIGDDGDGKYTYNDGNLIKKEYSSDGDDYVKTFEYDTKNNPFRNVIGYSLLLDGEQSVAANNVAKIASSTSDVNEISTYTYDANGFPMESKNFNGTNLDGGSKFEY